MATDENIGANVAVLRGEISQKDLASRMRERGWKWSQATVWSVEKGERPLRLAEAADLAEILDQSIHVLLSGAEPTRVHKAAQDVAAAESRLRSAIREYEQCRFELALLLDHVESSGHNKAIGESWIDVSAWEVVNRLHEEENRAGRIDMELMGVTDEDVAANQLEGHWVQRLARVDDGEHQAEG